MIHRLLGPHRPRALAIVVSSPVTVKQAQLGARWLWLLLATCALFLCGFGPPQLVDREIGATERVSVGELRAWAEQSAFPQITAQSYLLYDMSSDRIVYEHNSVQARPPASLTKLMTALLVFEHGHLDEVVQVEEADLVDGSTMGLAAGDTVSVTDLLWGLLLPSGNDAAAVLARYVSGSVSAFAAQMNQRAQELGLAQSHFVNPHGLDADGHLSSAADLLQLTRMLWEYPLFRTIVGSSQAQWNGHTLANTNELLTTFDGATGVKTGTTDNAGECLVASVERDGHTVFMVILGSSDRYGDAEKLYDSFRTAYGWASENGREMSIFNRLYDAEGRIYYLQTVGPSPSILQAASGIPQLRAYRQMQGPLSGEVASGSQVGTLEWWAGGKPVGTQPLVVR